jgi:hypothetical protein
MQRLFACPYIKYRHGFARHQPDNRRLPPVVAPSPPGLSSGPSSERNGAESRLETALSAPMKSRFLRKWSISASAPAPEYPFASGGLSPLNDILQIAEIFFIQKNSPLNDILQIAEIFS